MNTDRYGVPSSRELLHAWLTHPGKGSYSVYGATLATSVRLQPEVYSMVEAISNRVGNGVSRNLIINHLVQIGIDTVLHEDCDQYHDELAAAAHEIFMEKVACAFKDTKGAKA